MPDYANGKIYKIVGEDGSVYYGSTTMCLKERMRKHRISKDTSAYQKIMSQMDCEIILVENYPCDSRKELEDREAWYIRESPCVNRCIPGRTGKDIVAYQKKYYEENREEIQANKNIRDRWIRSFGNSRYTNCIQRCDPSLFQ